MLGKINKIVLLFIMVVSCDTPSTDIFGTETIYHGLMLPYEISQNLYTKKSNSYGYSYDEKKQLLLYTYYNEGSELIFQYNYVENSFIGAPFIYCFDYFYNDSFTFICEVANPDGINCHFFINETEVKPDTNNLIHFKFRKASHIGDFEVKVQMGIDENPLNYKEWTRKVTLIDSTYFVKENMIKHDLWNDYIP
jgi:hypothetical protein